MGAAASLVERAWRVRRGRDDLLVLTRAEVAEDEACLAAQRAAIRYCREHIYYGAPVRVSAVRSAAHHLPTALVSLDSARAAPALAGRAPGGAAAVAGYPEACVARQPATSSLRRGAPGRRVIRAATLAADRPARAAGAGRRPAGRRCRARRRVAALGGARRGGGRPLRGAAPGAAGGGGGARRRSAGARSVPSNRSAATRTRRGRAAWRPARRSSSARARNHRGWSQWSRAVTLRAARHRPTRPDGPPPGTCGPTPSASSGARRAATARPHAMPARAARTRPAVARRLRRTARGAAGGRPRRRHALRFSVSAANGAGASGPSPPALVRTPSATRAADGDAGAPRTRRCFARRPLAQAPGRRARARLLLPPCDPRAPGRRAAEPAAAADAQGARRARAPARAARRDPGRPGARRGAAPRPRAGSSPTRSPRCSARRRRRCAGGCASSSSARRRRRGRPRATGACARARRPRGGLPARTARGELELVAAPAGAADAKRADAPARSGG